MPEEKKLFLLDAYALIYRAYYAFIRNPLVNSKGTNVSAITGFLNTLHDLIQNEKPTHLAVVFDSNDEKTTRAQEFSYYKANREKMPEDIAMSIPIIKDIIDGFNIPRMELAGFEADDIIGTVAKQKEKEGYKVYMVTPDKDYAQLVSENIFMYKPSRQGGGVEILGVKEILEKWEIDRPEQVIDILGMWGDAVDNIPGLPGIGEKTAKKLVKEYGSMEGLFQNIDKLKGKQKEKVENNIQQGLDSKMLATIILDVPVEVSNEDLLISEPNREKLTQIFAELEFRTIGKKILGESYSVNIKQEEGQLDLFSTGSGPVAEIQAAEKGKSIENVPHNYHLMDTPQKRKALIAVLQSAKRYAWDTETTGIDPLVAELVGMSFSVKQQDGYYVPFPTDFDEATTLAAEFKEVLEGTTAVKIGQNIKYDMKVMLKYGIKVSEPIFDTMVAHYLVEPSKRHNMDYLAETYLGYSPVSIEKLIGKKGKNQKSMRDVPIPDITEYATEDADITWQLAVKMNKLLKEREVEDLYNDLELPLVPVLVNIEAEGVALDKGFLEDYSKELGETIFELKKEVREISGVEFNLDSPKQLGDVLFNHMGIPYKGKKTKTGQFSTNEETLSKLVGEHKIASIIMDYREATKLKSTYVDALPALVNERTGRLHTTFQQTIASTGRLSSTNPNLQNIPIRTERGRRIRKAFIPRDKNHILMAADYSQVELRLAAEISGDEAMLNAFKENKDIHTEAASRIYGVAESEVTREMRGVAKIFNFSIIYGATAFGLSQQTPLSRTEAAEMIENYFTQFPGIKKYMGEIVYFAQENGYVKTILGRRRYLKDINSANQTVRSAAERLSINSPIQGSAADLVKVAMIDIHKEMQERKLRSKMTLQVHDELVFDVHKEEVDELKELVTDKMQNAIETKVPIRVDVGIGDNWLEAH